MINLRLAEYDLETGKFKSFLELGKDFLFGGDIIVFHNPSSQNNYKYFDCCGVAHIDYKKDKKDPLKRFNGLFNGRTYGEGRFVLIINYQDNINKNIEYDGYEDVYIYTLGTDIEANFIEPENLHENPELYEKINK